MVTRVGVQLAGNGAWTRSASRSRHSNGESSIEPPITDRRFSAKGGRARYRAETRASGAGWTGRAIDMGIPGGLAAIVGMSPE